MDSLKMDDLNIDDLNMDDMGSPARDAAGPGRQFIQPIG
jgi:hypothetical protein